MSANIPADLTDREQEILRLINLFVRRHGYQPSFRELAAALDVRSTSTVHHYVGRLERKGVLRRIPGRPRGLESRLTRVMSSTEQGRPTRPAQG